MNDNLAIELKYLTGLKARVELALFALNTFDWIGESSVSFSVGYNLVIIVYNRHDLQQALRLSPKWEKTKGANYIGYEANVLDVSVLVQAYDAALPPTCKVILEDALVPEVQYQPARIVKVSRIMCELSTPNLKTPQDENTSTSS